MWVVFIVVNWFGFYASVSHWPRSGKLTKLGRIIRPNTSGRSVPEVVPDAWEAVALSSNGVDSPEDIICGVVARLLIITRYEIVTIATLNFRLN